MKVNVEKVNSVVTEIEKVHAITEVVIKDIFPEVKVGKLEEEALYKKAKDTVTQLKISVESLEDLLKENEEQV